MSNVTRIDKARGITSPEEIIEQLVHHAPRIKRIVVAFVEVDEHGNESTLTRWSSQQLSQVLYASKVIEHLIMQEALG